MTHRLGVGVLCATGCLLVAGLASPANGPEDQAQAAAESWLKLVDGGAYSASWDQAASVVKAAVKQADWSETVKGARAPVGRLMSRRLTSRTYTESMPTSQIVGGKVYTWGHGKYVTIQYDAAFASKASAVERVIATLDKDGVWRVSGYSVH
jgi:hypothetical protein